MANLHAIHLKSVDELRAAAAAWDDLWWRSDAALPTARAELIAQWVEQFQPRTDFHALAVADDDRLIAALPLVGRRVGRILSAGGLPGNFWSPSGDLLLDPNADTDAAIDLLLATAGQLPWQLLWLNETVPESPRWRTLLRACDRAGVTCAQHERFRVGRVEINGDWELFQKQMSKSHRQGMNRAARRLGCEGDVQFDACSHLGAEQVEPWLHAAFEVEDRSWKGEAGSSVLRTPGMFPFFVRQAQQLAEWGQLQVASLRLDGQRLAFVYGFRAKGVCFAHKIGYDPHFAAFSPGQLLFWRLLEQLHLDGDIRALDFMGPLTESLSRWRPATYGVGRIALALPRPLGRAAMYAYKHWWPRVRQFKQRRADGDRVGAPSDDRVSSVADIPVCRIPGADGNVCPTVVKNLG